jgi:hypothetical protein
MNPKAQKIRQAKTMNPIRGELMSLEHMQASMKRQRENRGRWLIYPGTNVKEALEAFAKPSDTPTRLGKDPDTGNQLIAVWNVDSEAPNGPAFPWERIIKNESVAGIRLLDGEDGGELDLSQFTLAKPGKKRFRLAIVLPAIVVFIVAAITIWTIVRR